MIGSTIASTDEGNASARGFLVINIKVILAAREASRPIEVTMRMNQRILFVLLSNCIQSFLRNADFLSLTEKENLQVP